MSFAKVESEIIRDADMDGSLKSTPAESYIKLLFDLVCDLRDQSDSRGKEFDIGCVGQALILVCAKEDLDLTTCIRKAVEK